MIPCKREKCLKYPVCKSKTEIACSDLRKYFMSLSDHNNKRWAELNETFPHLKRLGITVMNGTWYPPVENPTVELEKCRKYYKSYKLGEKVDETIPIKHVRMTLERFGEY